MNKKKTMLAIAAGVLVLACLVWFLNALFMPKYMSEIPEGALIREYYDETERHEILFVGDCEVYENFSPDVLWTEYGLTSYFRGSAQQLIWQSYWLLAEMLERETPDVVVFNVLSMKYDTPQNEAYNRMSIDGMKLSKYKLGSVKASMTEEETALSYLVPLLRYHSRWSELTTEDVTYLFRRDRVSNSGYLMNVHVKPVDTIPDGKPLADYSFGSVCRDYLERMRLLCEEKGVAFVLIKAPSLWPYWYDEWDAQIKSYAESHNVPYVNLLARADEIGIDWQTDTYDGGLHLNVYGAEKTARWFGAWLTERYDLADYRPAAVLSDNSEEARIYRVWARKHEDYTAEKARREEEYKTAE